MSLSSCFRALFCLLLLLPELTAAQTSYNRWEAQSPAPVAKPARPATAPPPTRNTGVVELETIAESATEASDKTRGNVVEIMPEFPGGYPAYRQYVQKNLKRPKGPRAAGVVLVTFTVLPSGAVTDAHVAAGKGISPAYDAAAVELISKAPAFMPGKRAGKPAAIEVKLPVEF
ncbi:energy transducer TonB [Hymenobacter sp. BT635]|uniref:Energy transducer TonB n=1 Tax=Hymenobacter nitidus TaxID=2880929 RepID=A0ABS8AJR6_9BACT|nr:TonB family protein [Hymenobacter nitidus]MCB2380136.1 energy transducer TonB [Hymenobacter nitidus]